MDAWVPPSAFDGYRLVNVLGAGGMGRVYLCNDQLLDRLVAIKFIAHPDPDPRRCERFLREGRALARLVHPNVVLTFRVGEVEGKPFLVSEFVRGRSLAQHAVPMHWRRVLEIGIGIARGLAAAHHVGILHRDVKPANVMLTSEGHVKLIDFGLAKFIDHTDVPRSSPAPAATSPVVDQTESDANGGASAELDVNSAISRPGGRLGTPRYMAPEILSGQAATQQSDVYSLGCVLYELCHGRLPHDPEVVRERPGNSIEDRIDAQFAEVLDRCLSPDLTRRYRSAAVVLQALEQLASDIDVIEPVPHGNPFRGLQAFDSQHRALFLGRSSEVKSIVERLRSDMVVVVAGDSGVGKSSLCRAGVLPLLSESGVQIDRGAVVLRVQVGRDPIAQCTTVLADFLSLEDAVVREQLVEAPTEILRALARVSGERTIVLFLDQIEELFTVADAEVAKAFAAMLANLALSGNQLRILATVRVDFLARLAAMPGLGPEVARAPYLLRPLGPDKLREVIVVPATRAGVRFASTETIDELVRASLSSDGSLPLLQFTLAELWDARDRTSNTIGADALARLGGVDGALERHADRVIAALPTEQLPIARRLLLRLVTRQRTRATLRRGDLDDPRELSTLEALIAGRLVVARGSESMTIYEIVHEAMITRWSALRRWLDESTEQQQRLERLAAAAAEWDRSGRRADTLWRGGQLTHLAYLTIEVLPDRDRAFLSASRRLQRRTRVLQAAIPTLFAMVVIGAIASARLRAQAKLDATVASRLTEARQFESRAMQHDMAALQLRAQAFELFDRGCGFQAFPPDARTWSDAEATWARVLEADAAIAGLRARASAALEAALLIDPARDDVRAELALVLANRRALAERMHNRELASELSNRVRMLVIAGAAPAVLGQERARLTVIGRDAQSVVTLARYRTESSGRIVEEPATPLVDDVHDLAPGSYVLEIAVAGRPRARLPIVLDRGQHETLELPRLPARMPDDMVFVPAGKTQVGSEEENLRVGLDMPPLHAVHVEPFLIGRFEVTIDQYIEWLETLDRNARATRLPLHRSQPGSIELRDDPKGWTLVLRPTTTEYVVRRDEPVRYRGRSTHAVQNWRRLPVTGISFEDATAFAAWLRRTRLPGAHVCSELEWTRAARGADDRIFTIGRRLLPSEANFDLTYGGTDLAFGPDAVGSHPESASIFGVEDLHGNAEEMVAAARWTESTAVLGGSWYHERVQQRLDNRFRNVPSTRHMLMGFRVCSPVP